MVNRVEGARIKILICDDHPMMQVGIREILSTRRNLEVVGVAADGKESVISTRSLQPDIVLMDIALPGEINGLEATRLIQKEMPHIKVIILTMHDDEEYIRQFVKSGASGYVLKKSPPDELHRAIESVSNGDAYFSPQVASILLKEQKGKQDAGKEEDLTDREVEVLKLVARGATSKEIGQKLCISARTVGKYREVLMRKLNVHSVAELTRYAISKRMIPPRDP